MSLNVGDVVWWYCAERDAVKMGEVVILAGALRARVVGGWSLNRVGGPLRSSEWQAHMDYADALEARARDLNRRAAELEEWAALARGTAERLRGVR